jgi:hypothetical protein
LCGLPARLHGLYAARLLCSSAARNLRGMNFMRVICLPACMVYMRHVFCAGHLPACLLARNLCGTIFLRPACPPAVIFSGMVFMQFKYRVCTF